ncbi:response regulator transcription factor [candidate division KSB1 bacterium]|nr:response regulator transcription factor [candidate division KSB1 bacterium]
MTILLVEDNPQMGEMIRKVLRNKMVEIDLFILATNENEAVILFQHGEPDWVLMDIKLASGDGLSATRRIRRIDPEGKIIIVSQYDEPEYRESAEEAGAIGYVLKDDLSEIVNIIEHH